MGEFQRNRAAGLTVDRAMMNTLSNSPKLKGASLCLGVLLLGVGVAPLARSAGLDVNLILNAPPPPRHEVIIERSRPGPDYVWINGYWGNNHGRQEWVAGHWARPPHARAVWVEPRWERRDRGYVFVNGYWGDRSYDDDRRDDDRRDHRDDHRDERYDNRSDPNDRYDHNDREREQARERERERQRQQEWDRDHDRR